MAPESATVDVVDQQILRCLQIAPRAPYAAIAEVLGVSEQTIARRYRRMRSDGVVRVTALLEIAAVGQSNWLVRVSCRPTGADALARALAQRSDVGWVSLVGGGTEIFCVIRARTSEAREDLLIQRLPRSAPVLGMTAMLILHRYRGGAASPTDDWWELAHLLDDRQAQAMSRWAVVPEGPPSEPADPDDLALLDALARDGRASHAALAAATGMTETRVARRLQNALADGRIYLDVDIAGGALGLHAPAALWLTVAPHDLARVGDLLAREREVAFAAAVTGAQNLAASVVCRDVDALYRFVTERVGAIDGVQALELQPVLRHVKQAGSLMEGGRLAT